MTNEIKEKIDDIFWEVKKYPMDSDYLVKKEEMELLLDCITNLQEENENLHQRINKAVEYINHEWFKREKIGIAPLQFSYEELQNVLDILRGDE